MGNIHAFNCCTNPSSEPIPLVSPVRNGAAARRPENSTPSTSKLPAQSSHGHRSDQLCITDSTPGKEMNENLSSEYAAEQVFLSHSGKQKNFVEQLYEDLNRANISCFFDERTLLKGQEFPPHILYAAQKCKVAVVVLSENFITSKWPMIELSAFVKARKTTNPKLEIFPLFYKMSPDRLSRIIHKFEKNGFPKYWKQFANGSKKRPIDLKDWMDALKALRPINGPIYDEMQGEVAYRSLIVSAICRLIGPNIKYEDAFIKGKERLCQVVANLFDSAPNYMDGVKVVGLYGLDGSGKTTMCKILCDFYCDKFEGLTAFHAEFQNERLPVECLKRLIMILTDTGEAAVKFVNSYAEALHLLKRRMRSPRVFLALDNIPDRLESIKEVQAYLAAGFGEGSHILLTARSADILERVIPQEETRSFMHVPNLTEEEAIEVLLSLTSVKTCDLRTDQKYIARECAELCRFDRGMNCGPGNYNPLALMAFGAYLCLKFTCKLAHNLQIPDEFRRSASWNGAEENPFHIFEQSFNGLDPKYLRIFMLLTFYAPHLEFVANFDYFGAVFKWLANVSSYGDNQCMCDAIRTLKDRGLIEGCGRNRIAFHGLWRDIDESKLKQMEKWMSVEGEDKIPILARTIVETIKFKDCSLIRSLNLAGCSNVRSIYLHNIEYIREVPGIDGLTALEYLELTEMDNVVELPSFQGLTNLRHLSLRDLPKLNEKPDLSNCHQLKMENIHISKCKWQHESHYCNTEILTAD